MSTRPDGSLGIPRPVAGAPRWIELPDERHAGFADRIDRPLTPELLVCAAAVRTGLAAGCAASLVIDPEQRYVLAVTDATVAALAEAQFGVWRGPCPQAVHTGETVVVPNPAAMAARWPRLAPRLAGLPPFTLASVPLPGTRGPIGVLTAYRHENLPFGATELAELEAVAGAVAALARTRFSVTDATVRLPPSTLAVAAGLLAADLDLDEDRAVDLLRGAAEARGVTLGEIAEDVVGGRLPTAALLDRPGQPDSPDSPD
jgi:hypothetical protein